jgi:putative membrane protein
MKTRLTIATALALALAACGSNDDAAAPAAEDTTAAAPDAADPSTPQGFVAMAASSDMYEIEAGKLAQQMGTSDAVKQFGAMMEKDHTASSEKLKEAVTHGGAELMFPPGMQPKHQQQLDALRNAGDQFDTLYAQQQLAAHQEALSLLQTQASSGTVDSLKAFAAETAPVVQGHLEHARELAGAAAGGDPAPADAGSAEDPAPADAGSAE